MKVLFIGASLALAFGGAQALSIDFGSGPAAPTICANNADGSGVMAACFDGSPLNQGYGDVAGVLDVTYSQPTSATSGLSLRWWEHDYNNLYGVAWADGNDTTSHARIELKPLNGGSVNLTSFDFGAYSNTSRNTHIDIYAIGGGTPLYTFSQPVGAGTTTHTPFTVNVTSANGLWIDWQNSAYNIGIDNISFNVTAVPEPQTYALMLAGLAVVGSLARRRRG